MHELREKKCNKCNEIKSIDNFYKIKAKIQSWCKNCINLNSLSYQKIHKEKINERSREYRKKNREKVLERDKRYRILGRVQARINSKKVIDELKDSYIIKLITRNTMLIKNDIPKELIDIYRYIINFKREIKNG